MVLDSDYHCQLILWPMEDYLTFLDTSFFIGKGGIVLFVSPVSWKVEMCALGRSVVSDSHILIDGSLPGSSVWDSPGKNTGVGCHFLLQWMKVKSQSDVAQLCLTLSDLMDCSLPGSSIRGIFQARVLVNANCKLNLNTWYMLKAKRQVQIQLQTLISDIYSF